MLCAFCCFYAVQDPPSCFVDGSTLAKIHRDQLIANPALLRLHFQMPREKERKRSSTSGAVSPQFPCRPQPDITGFPGQTLLICAELAGCGCGAVKGELLDSLLQHRRDHRVTTMHVDRV